MRPRYLTAESLNAIKARINKEMARRDGYGSLAAYAGTGYFEGYRNLPDGYTQVEYIQSSGTQYINTGFIPDSESRIVLDFYADAGTSIKALFGARIATASNVFGLWLNYSSSVYPHYGSVTYTSNPIVLNDNQRLIYDMNGNVTTVGSANVSFNKSTFDCSYSLTLFAMNTAGAIDSRMAVGKLYSCQIYDNGTLVRDYVPCINSSGVAGLYDLVNSVFYMDAAGGTFTTGDTFAGIDVDDMAIKDHRKMTFDLLIHINDFASDNALSDNKNDILIADIDEAEAFVAQLEVEGMYDSSSSCRGACTGLCVGTCTNSCSGCTDSCSGGCGNACTSCGSGCSRTCSGCTGGCSGCSGCSGCGSCGSCSSSCSSGCSGCTGSCSYSCALDCTSSCFGDCSSCTGGCIGSCTGACYACSGCSGGCSGACLGCGTSCGGSCGSSATASCASCSGYCTSCSGTCQGCSGCSGGCGDGCSGCGGCVNCSGGCYSGCTGCSSSCTSTCSNNCSGVCNGCNADCVGGCTGACSGCSSGCTGCSSCSGCSGACSGGCSATCSNACSATCINSCSSCSGGCGGCSGSCGTECSGSCSSNCSTTCYSNCTGTCYGQSTSSITS